MESMVVLMALAALFAGRVAGLALTVLYAVHQIMFCEKRERAEDTALIYRA